MRATPGDVDLKQKIPVEKEEELVEFDSMENGVHKTMNKEGGLPFTPTNDGCRDRKGNEKSNLTIDSVAEPLDDVKENHSCKSDESRNQPKETAFDWLVLACAFGSNVIFGMDFNCFSVFYPSLVEYFEATTAQVAWVASIQTFVGSVLSRPARQTGVQYYKQMRK